MIVPLILFVASLAGLGAALILPGWSDLLLLALPCATASLVLLALAQGRGGYVSKSRPERPLRDRSRVFRKSVQKPEPKPMLVDGSNVLYWKDNTPRIETVREVLSHLSDLGFTPGVMFDANAGYLISGRYQDDGPLAQLLGLPVDRVLVVPKGSPADPTLLAAARKLGAQIVSNDRFRDWAETHPEVREPGHLIRGGYLADKLWLDLNDRSG